MATPKRLDLFHTMLVGFYFKWLWINTNITYSTCSLGWASIYQLFSCSPGVPGFWFTAISAMFLRCDPNRPQIFVANSEIQHFKKHVNQRCIHVYIVYDYRIDYFGSTLMGSKNGGFTHMFFLIMDQPISDQPGDFWETKLWTSLGHPMIPEGWLRTRLRGRPPEIWNWKKIIM